jgi:thiol-disulfide isomerase/thioredoxin
MRRLSRRSLLRGAAVAGGASLAGCLGQLTGGAEAISLDRAVGPGPEEVALVASDQPVVLDFFATWCAPCIPQLTTLRAAAEKRPDVHYVSITTESNRKAVAQWWESYGGNWPAVLDPEATAQSAYRAPRLPTTLVLPPGGGPGEEVWRHVGVARTKRVVAAIDRVANAADAAPDGGTEPLERTEGP